MAGRAQLAMERETEADLARTRPPSPEVGHELARLTQLQRSAGNAAVAAMLQHRARTGASPRLPLQRCGPVPCDCSDEEQAQYEAEHPGGVDLGGLDPDGPEPDGVPPLQRAVAAPTASVLQRDDDDDGGVLDWLGEQAGGAVDTVSDAAGGAASSVADAAGGAVEWAADQGSAAVDAVADTASGAASAVSDAAGGAVDWAAEQGSAAASAVSDAAGGAVDWAADQGAAAVGAVTDAAGSAWDATTSAASAVADAVTGDQIANVLGQIGSARQRLSGQSDLAVSPEHLSALNAKLSSLGGSMPGLGGVSGVSAQPAAEGEEQTVPASSLDGVLASLQSALSGAAGGSAPAAAQRSVQRYLSPEAVAAIAAAGAAGAETAEGGALIAAVAAPETLGISLVVLAVVVVVVAIVVGIIVYASTRSPAPTVPVPANPTMPEGLSKEKKKKWEQCQDMYETYKKGTGKEVSSLAKEINELKKDYGKLTPAQKTELCAKVHEQLEMVQQLINDRQNYIKSGCDEFDWFGRGSTEDDRRQSHEREVDNVRAQEGNLRGLLKRLQDEGAC